MVAGTGPRVAMLYCMAGKVAASLAERNGSGFTTHSPAG